ncbi:hypothetical protein DPMN_168121 [Dreissena polymorpha]|uniref:Uncharacterized protein n=1 Tax=Dreissena polymorpha TaxID=45954 RepID=A0A9D4F235_DREPO|nr:hypothetical protein DPMN_168121 [Dreissena polymorpha]
MAFCTSSRRPLHVPGDLTAFVLRPYGDQSRPYGVRAASLAFLVRSYCDHSRSEDAIDVQRTY